MADPLRIFIVAGEPSGDRLGAALMDGLNRVFDDKIGFKGIGGPMMQDKNLISLFPMQELSLFGLLELLPKWWHLKRRLAQTVAAAIAAKPDIIITIDSPGFCLRLAAALKGKTNALMVHYVAPSVWAWRPGRAQEMANYIDHVLALLPFEPPYMHKAGMSCDFVGHPVVAENQPSQAQVAAFRTTQKLTQDTQLITLLPGSRSSEIKRLAPIFFATAKNLQRQHPDLAFVIPVAAPHLLLPLQKHLQDAGLQAILLDPQGMSSEKAASRKRICFAASRLALAASGTVSIELAAAGVPMVIGYKVNFLTGWIMRRAMLAPSFTLVNLLTESTAVPEFFSKACNPLNLQRELSALLDNLAQRDHQIAIGAQAIKALGQGGQDPGLRAAKSVLAALKTRQKP